MKPLKPVRKPPEMRVTRKTNIHLNHSDGHGWAVSYADLLMVLLSFFVLYFSFSDKSPDEVDNELKKIALSMEGMSTAEVERQTRKPDSVGISSLSDLVKIDGVKVTENGDHLLLELQSGAFRSGVYQPDRALKAQIDRIFEKLRPLQDKLALTVVGHSDKRPLVNRTEFLQDNFDLSSLRALRVMKYVVAKGFPESHASARAASSFDRDARSITLELRLMPVAKAGGAS